MNRLGHWVANVVFAAGVGAAFALLLVWSSRQPRTRIASPTP
jgi:hypothetical protein